MLSTQILNISHVARDFEIADHGSAFWAKSSALSIDRYWSGENAPAGRAFSTRQLWSDTALYVRFEARQTEPLVVNQNPDVTKKVRGLWDRDVCEIFIAPDRSERNKYFEFEIAPTGEWVDLAIELTSGARKTGFDYKSGMETAARIDKDTVVMAMKIPFASLGKMPKAGDIWLGNLFRCVGKGETRGYLAWSPTKTKEPNFHVPAAFGEFHFTK